MLVFGRLADSLRKNLLEIIDFTSENHTPEPSKIKPPLQREHDLSDFEILENNLPFRTIWVPTCHHFAFIFRVMGRLGRILGRLGSVLGRLGALLGASWRILARLGASWNRLGAVLKPS